MRAALTSYLVPVLTSSLHAGPCPYKGKIYDCDLHTKVSVHVSPITCMASSFCRQPTSISLLRLDLLALTFH